VAEPKPPAHVVVLFGATGDLARRKLIPALYHLAVSGLMPDAYRIVGTSLDDVTTDDFRHLARESLDEFARVKVKPDVWSDFADLLSYAHTDRVSAAVDAAEAAIGGAPERLYHLSVPPAAMAGLVEMLGETGLADRARVIMEKPFGTDLDSARELNRKVHAVLGEEQVYRIDHFLGKEAVQNILALRFANGMFEPVWNREHVSQVQIDVPETLTIGTRASFYEKTGAFRDMVVTHLFQVLGFVAMEPPTSFDAAALGREKLKVFESMSPLDPSLVVRGQYEGYRSEDGVAPDSQTETFVAARVDIDNWRWADIPFNLRTGKAMAESHQLVSIVFREPPKAMFPHHARAGDFGPNHLRLELSDPPAMSLSLLGKRPGVRMVLDEEHLDFSFGETPQGHSLLEAYERLLHDAMLGDRTLFTSADGIERLWELSMPALEHPTAIQTYAPGSWGPGGAADLPAPCPWALPSV
jgi:glucose-6-phosphate 1-dehydrogenase